MSEMLELGTLLREERERKGLTIQDLSERIKLAPRTIAFIESGTKSELPHAVYVKGFVKSYAMVVGLDPEELGAMVDVAYKEELEEEVAEPVVSRRERKGISGKLIVIIVLVIALAVAGYFFVQSSSADLSSDDATVEVPVQPKPAAPEKAEPVEPVEKAETVTPAPAVKEAPAQVEKEAKPEPKVVAEAPKKAAKVTPKPTVAKAKPAPAPKTVAKTPVVAPADVAEKKQAEQVAEKAPAGPMHLLRIQATADCWIEATGDGFPRKEFLLRDGEGHTVSFPNNLALRLGNSGGISLTLDGVPYPFNGTDGKVRTVHITGS